MHRWGLPERGGAETIAQCETDMLDFWLYLFLFFIAPVAVVGLILVVINHYWDNRKYLEFEEQVHEGQKAESDMPKEPYE
jgi:hypothetical protein